MIPKEGIIFYEQGLYIFSQYDIIVESPSENVPTIESVGIYYLIWLSFSVESMN